MVRLAISVEGQTEEIFLNSVLQPHLERLSIKAHAILIGDKRSKGGDVSLKRVQSDLNKLANSFDKVTTLYDFYGFKDKSENDDKVSLEEKIKLSVSESLRHKVIPYIQMYEFEGLLFSSPDIIGNHLSGNNLSHSAGRIVQEFGDDPERINDSQQTAPSKRLEQHTDYIKTIHGPNICQEIGLARLRERCSGFNDWITSLEVLSEH